MTVDKPPLALWVQALSAARLRPVLVVDPRAPGGHGRRRRRVHLGPDAPPLRPRRRLRRRSRPRHHADGRRDLPAQQPGRRRPAVLRRGALGHRPRAGGRAHALARPRRRDDRTRVRGEDGRRAARGARAGRRVPVGLPPRLPRVAAPAARGPRRAGRRRRDLAAARGPHARVRPPVHLRAPTTTRSGRSSSATTASAASPVRPAVPAGPRAARAAAVAAASSAAQRARSGC